MMLIFCLNVNSPLLAKSHHQNSLNVKADFLEVKDN